MIKSHIKWNSLLVKCSILRIYIACQLLLSEVIAFCFCFHTSWSNLKLDSLFSTFTFSQLLTPVHFNQPLSWLERKWHKGLHSHLGVACTNKKAAPCTLLLKISLNTETQGRKWYQFTSRKRYRCCLAAQFPTYDTEFGSASVYDCKYLCHWYYLINFRWSIGIFTFFQDETLFLKTPAFFHSLCSWH